jgi:hypothetical protein
MEKESKLLVEFKDGKTVSEIIGEPEDLVTIIISEMMFNRDFRVKMTETLKLLEDFGVTNPNALERLRAKIVEARMQEVVNEILSKL